MSLTVQFLRHARYNRWMNERLYAACAALEPDQLVADAGAFFGSVFDTLNHILVADTIWMQRFALHPRRFASAGRYSDVPMPISLRARLHENLPALTRARAAMDASIIELMQETQEPDFAQFIEFADMAGRPQRDPFATAVQHFFNHQTHHRGQVTTLLSQRGIDFGVTDLIAFAREYDAT